MNIYRPRLMFLQVKEVKKDKRLKLNTGTVEAKAGQYIVTFPDGNESLMHPDFVASGLPLNTATDWRS